MLRLDSYLLQHQIQDVHLYTKTRFTDTCIFNTPEALALYELRLLERDVIKSMCEHYYGHTLYEPARTYIPPDIAEKFLDSNVVPATYLPMQRKLIAVYVPELQHDEIMVQNYEVEVLPTTIYYFFECYQEKFGRHRMLLDIPAKQLLDFIYEEGIQLQASDVTISTMGKQITVYYNVRKKKVMSNRILSNDAMRDVILTLTLNAPYDMNSCEPRYVDIDMNKEYRGRVTINRKHKGHEITIRFLPKVAFNRKLEELNLSPDVISWMRNSILDGEAGLRLIVGEPMSGKNTTALALLREIVEKNDKKIVTVEMPVEQELTDVEQISANTVEEYDANIRSLIKQNPDFVYITEIVEETGLSTIRIANVGKRVLATLHANSVADTITRIMDITNMSLDRVLQTLHSVCFQQLVRDETNDTIRPKCRYLRFTKELKFELYDKSLGEVIKIISRKEGGDPDWISM